MQTSDAVDADAGRRLDGQRRRRRRRRIGRRTQRTRFRVPRRSPGTPNGIVLFFFIIISIKLNRVSKLGLVGFYRARTGFSRFGLLE